MFHTISLDTFVPSTTFIDILKIDVEGHDPEVLMGARRLFKENRIGTAIVEINDKFWTVDVFQCLKILCLTITLCAQLHVALDQPTCIDT